MTSKTLFSKKNIINFSLFLVVFSLLGFSNEGSGFLYLPELFGSFPTIIMLVSLLVAFLIAFSSNVNINIFLLIGFSFHIVISIFSLLINNLDFTVFIYRINISIIPFFIIWISSYIAKCIEPEKVINNVLSFFLVWLSIQTIGTVLTTYLTTGSILKKEIEISVGNSNFIGALLLICLVYFTLLPQRKDNILLQFTFIIGIIGLGLTFSFGTMASFLIILYLHYISNNKKSNKNILIITFLSFLTIILYQLLLNGTLLKMTSDTVFFDFIYKATYKVQDLVGGNYDAAFAGRGVVFASKLELIYERPIIGYGTNVETVGQIRSHNWILDSLVYTGILGTTVYLLLIGYVMIKVRRNRYTVNNGNASYFSLLAGIIHGLIEPNFFSKPFDFIWWLIAITTFYTVSNVKVKVKGQKILSKKNSISKNEVLTTNERID